MEDKKQDVEIEQTTSNTNPQHYKLQDGSELIEHIKVILTKDEFIGFCKGNIIKYITRDKNGVEDIKKAKIYLDYMIDLLEVKNDK